MTELQLAICEAENSGDIDMYTRDSLLSVLTEASISPLRKSVERIKAIKRAKPSEYSDAEYIKQYIDKYGDDLISVAKILEREPETLRRREVKFGCATFILSVGAMVTMMALNLPLVIELIGLVLTVILPLPLGIIEYMRKENDESVSNDLSKIRSSLKKLDSSKLPDKYRRKINDVIDAIDDAETEIAARVKVQKESVLEEIYEAELNGEITPEERMSLIDYMDY